MQESPTITVLQNAVTTAGKRLFQDREVQMQSPSVVQKTILRTIQ